MEKKNGKKIALGVGIVVVLVAVLCAVYFRFAPKVSKGNKTVTIEVTDDAGETASYEVTTGAEYLRGAMDEAEGLTYDGTESDYGFMVESINGVSADYVKEGAYWAIYVDGAYGNYGIDAQPLEDGHTYQLVYTIAE